MNKALFIGNLTKDPELRTTSNGIPVCNFTIAVNRKYRDQQGKQGVDYFDITVWRGLAENCAEYLRKGRKVAIWGECQTGSYQRQDGSHQKTWHIVADEVEFLPSPAQPQKDRAPEAQSEIERGFHPPWHGQDGQDDEFTEIDDDELPF